MTNTRDLLHASNFPSLLRVVTGKVRQQFESDIEAINAAHACGLIYKADLDKIVARLGNIFQIAANALNERFRKQILNASTPEFVNFVWKSNHHISINTFPDKLALARDAIANPVLSKNTFTRAYAYFLSELRPIVAAIIDLKPIVIEGSKPVDGTGADDTKPKTKLHTCPCCLRQVRLGDGVMVLHGYNRRGKYFADSCEGRRYEPLERSNLGLIHALNAAPDKIEKLKSLLAQLPYLEELPYHYHNGASIKVSRNDHRWQFAYRRQQLHYENEIKKLEQFLINGAERLANWEQTEFDYEMPNWLKLRFQQNQN